jgi:hypothetical protein
VPELITWVADQLCILEPHGPPVETVEQLAEALHRTLREQPAVLLLDRIERLDGGLARFHAGFWRPLYDLLANHYARIPVQYRLIAVVGAYTGTQPAWAGLTVPWDPDAVVEDFRRLVCLPELNNISAKALARWLNDVGAVASPHRLQDISDAVLNDAEGKPDGTPVRVYRRLQGERLWPDGDRG